MFVFMYGLASNNYSKKIYHPTTMFNNRYAMCCYAGDNLHFKYR